MPATRGVKRTASQKEPKAAAGSTKTKKKVATAVLAPTPLKKLGEVFTCGQGDVGQLGHGEDSIEIKRFSHVKKLPSNIVQICAGGMHTVCLDRHGKVWTFGCNDEGALGRDTGGESGEVTPGIVDLPGKAVRVSAGDSHTAAVLDNGRLFAWGSFRDSHGSMGLTLKGNEIKPVELLASHNIVSIASGADHLVMLSDQGQIFTCGCGEQGQLGRVTARSCDRNSRLGLNGLLVPAPLVLSKDKSEFDAIWAGNYSTFARRANKGDIFVWGLNNYGQIGVHKGKPGSVFVPVLGEAFSTKTKWTHVAGGLHHTLALDSDGVCYAIGRCEYGRLGLGEGCSDAVDLVPVTALKDKKCIDIASGSASSFAVVDNGDVFAWGMGSSHQLGTGSENDENEPVLLRSKQLEGRSAFGVSVGGQHSVLLMESLNQEDDTITDAEVAGTAPKVKTDSKKESDKKSEELESKAAVEAMDVDTKSEEKPTKTATKRGRKPSSSASSESQAAKKKQNGGLSPTKEETDSTAAPAEKMEEESTEAKSVKGTQEEKPEESKQTEEEEPEKTESESLEEPSSKRIKLDVETEKTTEAAESAQPEPVIPASEEAEPVQESTPVPDNAEEKMDVAEEKTENSQVASVNGSVEENGSQKEVQDVEMKSTETEVTEKKIEAPTATENTASEVS